MGNYNTDQSVRIVLPIDCSELDISLMSKFHALAVDVVKYLNDTEENVGHYKALAIYDVITYRRDRLINELGDLDHYFVKCEDLDEVFKEIKRQYPNV